jgi:hypothetical protein
MSFNRSLMVVGLFLCAGCAAEVVTPHLDGGGAGGSGGGGSGGAPSTGGSGGTGGAPSTGGSGGAAPSTGGTGGAPSTGGSGGSARTDAGTPDRAAADAGSPADAGPIPDAGPISECPGASLDRLQKWLAHALVTGAAPDSSILVADGGRQVARAQFPGGNWSEVVVLLGNTTDAAIDLSKSRGFTISYSATADLWIEFRGTVQLHGGDQHAVKLPATAGMVTSKFVPFDATAWTFVPELGKPTVAFADVLRTANMFDIVGNTANTVSFTGLRFDGYVPACR